MKEKKSNPLDVQLKIEKNRIDKESVAIKLSGQFRNSGWKVKDHSIKILEKEILLDIKTTHSGGLVAMVLKPFEIVQEVKLKDAKRDYKVRVIIDGDEYVTGRLHYKKGD
ncbi:MAG: hypothetical protein ACTSRS_14255 [Candidatus Helarchaeota archaeon]